MVGTTEAESQPAVQPALQRLWRSRSLCFMLPLERGDRLAVMGSGADIANSARKAGVSTVSVLTERQAVRESEFAGEMAVIDGDAIPLPDASFDHVIIPRLTADLKAFVPQEVARVLRPSGSLFLGVPWSLRAPRQQTSMSIRSGRRQLERAGFENVRVYGVGSSLRQPRHIVPVDSPRALRWYLDAAYLPASRTGALASRLLGWAPARAGLLLFPALGFVAQRQAEDAPGG